MAPTIIRCLSRICNDDTTLDKLLKGHIMSNIMPKKSLSIKGDIKNETEHCASIKTAKYYLLHVHV